MEFRHHSPLLTGIIVAVLVYATIAGCGREKTQTARGGSGEAIPVEAVVVRSTPLEDKTYATGTLLAFEEVGLRPETSGRVVEVLFDEGRAVRKGDLLVKINDREYQAQLRRKQLEETLAADEERRKRGLFEINGISREEYDKAVNALRMVQAEREVIESQLAETEIRAPFDGVIGLRHVSVGSYVTPSTLVASLQSIDPIKVEFSVAEKYAGKLTPGREVSVQVGEDSERHRGRVYAVEAKIDPATRTLKARATIANPGGRLIPGAFSRVEITLEVLPDALVIPAGAVVPRINDEIVYGGCLQSRQRGFCHRLQHCQGH